MKKELAKTIANFVKQYGAIVKESDENPNMWYELFRIHPDEGTQTIYSADTFEEILIGMELSMVGYNDCSFNVDIWKRDSENEIGEQIIL